MDSQDFLKLSWQQRQQKNNVAKCLVEIIRNTRGGITVYTASVNDLCRDIYDETAVMVTPKILVDYWECEDYYRGSYQRTRINPRKNQLTIKS